MRADELVPCRGRLTLGSRWDAMALEDVAHGLITDGIAQVREGSDDPVIAPGAVFPRHTYHQRFQFRVDRGTPYGLALLRAVAFLSSKSTVPGENRVRCDNRGDFLEGLLAQLLADGGECLAFTVTQPDAPFDLVTEDAILGPQVLVAQQQFLIDGPRDIRQQVSPVHPLSPVTFAIHIA